MCDESPESLTKNRMNFSKEVSGYLVFFWLHKKTFSLFHGKPKAKKNFFFFFLADIFLYLTKNSDVILTQKSLHALAL